MKEGPVGMRRQGSRGGKSSTGWIAVLSAISYLLLCLPCRSSLAAARRTEPTALPARRHTLVAIGDSITFGYNLGNNRQPSRLAYPYLVAERLRWQTVDLGVPGWTSHDVLAHLGTPRFLTAIQRANLVVLDIGSNDLLQSARSLIERYQAQGAPGQPAGFVVTPADQAQLTRAVVQFAQNYAAIIAGIRRQSTAPIVLVNLYDPFPDTNPLHNASEAAIAAANKVIVTAAAESQSLFADVYLPFNHRQTRYVQVRTLDVHPTVAGQSAIANQVQAALDSPLWHSPNEYATAPAGVLVRMRPDSASDAIAWLHGVQGGLVTGVSGLWYEVVTPGSLTGYVPARSVTLLLRPWNDVSFGTISDTVTAVNWQCATTGIDHAHPQYKTVPGFIWRGVLYAPLAPLIHQAGYAVVWHNASRQADISETQTGLRPTTSAGREGAALTAIYTGAKRQVRITTEGVAVTVNGEFIQLGGQAVMVDQQVYVPVKAVWQAIGGSVAQVHPVTTTSGMSVMGRGTPFLRLIGPGGS